MKNVLIIGLGRFGRHIAMQLNQLGHEIMAVDWKEERVDKLRYLFCDYWRKLSEFS